MSISHESLPTKAFTWVKGWPGGSLWVFFANQSWLDLRRLCILSLIFLSTGRINVSFRRCHSGGDLSSSIADLLMPGLVRGPHPRPLLSWQHPGNLSHRFLSVNEPPCKKCPSILSLAEFSAVGWSRSLYSSPQVVWLPSAPIQVLQPRSISAFG